ncbi:hypothetical protein NP493_2128g00012 [Ridgeia piscesae]|uniref:Uncharacterized protein n=1 Tax=Ridgeia piscesae TaxID=27915 RepID=A0AAD9N322_RIDPI|nr:hypothetical protein NP493_2128g00012 [Ridgeia piscesae]
MSAMLLKNVVTY